jgi:hypothetical protein
MSPPNKAGGMSRPSPKRKAMLMTLQHGEAESGIPYTSILDLIHRGHLPCVRLPDSRRIWIKWEDLERLIERSVEREQ